MIKDISRFCNKKCAVYADIKNLNDIFSCSLCYCGGSLFRMVLFNDLAAEDPESILDKRVLLLGFLFARRLCL